MFSLLLLIVRFCSFHIINQCWQDSRKERTFPNFINLPIQVPRPLIEYIMIILKCWFFLRMTKNTVQRGFILFCSAVALLILPYAFMPSPLFIFDNIRQHPWLSCALFAFGMLAACQWRSFAMLLACILFFVIVIVCRIIQKFRIIVRLLCMWLWGRLQVLQCNSFLTIFLTLGPFYHANKVTTNILTKQIRWLPGLFSNWLVLLRLMWPWPKKIQTQ